jgi:hypothetical protein
MKLGSWRWFNWFALGACLGVASIVVSPFLWLNPGSKPQETPSKTASTQSGYPTEPGAAKGTGKVTESAKAGKPTVVAAQVRPDPPVASEISRPRFSSLRAAPVGEQRNLIDEEIAKLETGRIVYNPPSRVRLGVAERVQVRIAPPAVPEDKLRENLARPESAKQAALKISPLMNVTLTGSGFKIDPQTPAEQFLTRDEPTEWSWLVEGSQPGKKMLHLSARVKLLGEERQFKSFETEIEVWVSRTDKVSMFIANYWQWLVATAASSGLLGGLYRRFRRKNEPRSWENV